VTQMSTYHIGRRSRRALIAGLYLLLDHAERGFPSGHVLAVGEAFDGMEEPEVWEIRELIDVIRED
jgi:hypothetical protein